MNVSQESEQIVQITQNGARWTLRVSGQLAGKSARLLIQALEKSLESRGKTRLKNWLREGRSLRSLKIADKNMRAFSLLTKKAGIPFVVLKEPGEGKGLSTVLVRSEDAARLSRLLERESFPVEKEQPETDPRREGLSPEEGYLRAVSQDETPRAARTGPPESGRFYGKRSGFDVSSGRVRTDPPSVRKRLWNLQQAVRKKTGRQKSRERQR